MEWQILGTILLVVSLAVGWGFDSWQQAATFVVVLAAALGCVYRGLKGIFERDQWLTRVPALEDAVKAQAETIRQQGETIRALTETLKERHSDINELRRGLEETTEWKRDTPKLPRHRSYPNDD